MKLGCKKSPQLQAMTKLSQWIMLGIWVCAMVGKSFGVVGAICFIHRRKSHTQVSKNINDELMRTFFFGWTMPLRHESESGKGGGHALEHHLASFIGMCPYVWNIYLRFTLLTSLTTFQSSQGMTCLFLIVFSGVCVFFIHFIKVFHH